MISLKQVILRTVLCLLLFSIPAHAAAPSWYDEDLLAYTKTYLINVESLTVSQTVLNTIKYENMVEKALLQEGVEVTTAEISEVLGQIAYESGGNQSARGTSGEIGLMQLLPSTARLMHVNPRDAYSNILGGVRYREHLKNDWGLCGDMVLAGYNGGPVRVEKCRKCKKYIRAVTEWAKIFTKILNKEEV